MTNRLTQEDLDSFKIQPQLQEPESNKPASGVHFYTIFGKHKFIDEDGYPVSEENDPFLCAMRRDDNLYIKYDQHGQIFDPKNFKKTDPVERNNIPLFKLKRVSKEKFAAYMSFLKTGEIVYLTLARKIVDNVI